MQTITGLFILAALSPQLVLAIIVSTSSATSSASTSVAGGSAVVTSSASSSSAVATSSASSSSAVSTSVVALPVVKVYEETKPITVHKIYCYCDNEYAPVCGTNRVTYSNDCLLRCVAADHKKNRLPPVGLLHPGKCRPLNCNCPKIIDPVCGTNNKTYTNDCYRKCENDYLKVAGLPTIGLYHSDICKKASWVCPSSIIPVCGSNGKTYRNICLLQFSSQLQQAKRGYPITVASSGACKIDKCQCTLEQKQLCGSDDQTYYNPCAFNCQNRRLLELGINPLSIQYYGECINCICTADYNPVCGSDGKTYSNLCLLLCENKKRRLRGKLDLTYSKGPCCTCTKEWKPVCASDNTTWPNLCELNCEITRRIYNGQKKLSYRHDGVCPTIKPHKSYPAIIY